MGDGDKGTRSPGEKAPADDGSLMAKAGDAKAGNLDIAQARGPAVATGTETPAAPTETTEAATTPATIADRATPPLETPAAAKDPEHSEKDVLQTAEAPAAAGSRAPPPEPSPETTSTMATTGPAPSQRSDMEPGEKATAPADGAAYLVVTSTTNLRAEPNTASPVLAQLKPKKRLKLLNAKPRLGYYNVEDAAGTGWVWGNNVRTASAGDEAPPSPTVAETPVETPTKTRAPAPESTKTEPPASAAKPPAKANGDLTVAAGPRDTSAPAKSSGEDGQARTAGSIPTEAAASTPKSSPTGDTPAEQTDPQVAGLPPDSPRVEGDTGAVLPLIPDPGSTEAKILRTAEQGDAAAQYALGFLYYKGEGVRRDYGAAAKWIRKAAEQDHINAQHNLGFMYYKGMGVSQNFTTAATWFERAAEKGHVSSSYNLGYLFYKGKGVAQDYVKAEKLYRFAAEKGHAGAQYNLGILYSIGKGVPQDDAEAAEWFRRAAEQNHTGAQYNLGYLYYKGKGVPRDFAQAYAWFDRAAEQGDEKAAQARKILAGQLSTKNSKQ
jgi:hypothetical protein